MFPLYCQSFTLSEGWGAYSILLRRDERTKRLYYTHQRSALLSLPVSLVVLVSKTCLLLFEFYPFLRHFLLKQFQTLTFKGPNILNQYFRTQKFGTLMNSCCLSLVFKSAWAHDLLIYTQQYYQHYPSWQYKLVYIFKAPTTLLTTSSTKTPHLLCSFSISGRVWE